MNGRFINDVIEYKCKDGIKREAMIIKDFNNGRFDVAYIKSDGCTNVSVHVEENVSGNKLLGKSKHKETILPYNKGDLVAYYMEPEVYYLAHIVEVGAYNTVKILLGDLYMNTWVQDKKRGDYVEVEVQNIRWDGKADDFDKATKIKYGYEPWEFRDPHWKQKLVRGIFKSVVICAVGIYATYAVPRYLDKMQARNNQQVEQNVDTPPVTKNTKPSDEVMASYNPIERIFAEIYKKPLEDITDEEKSAITYLEVSENERITGTQYTYYVYYSIDGGEKQKIDFMTKKGIDSYNFPQFSGVTDLILTMHNLKTIDFIVDMPKLNRFDFIFTEVSDISSLAGLSIDNLKIDRNNEISDYSVLTRMPKLNTLYLNCGAEKIDSITEDLVNVEVLTASNKAIVEKCPNLKELNLSFFSEGTSAKDYSVITSCSSLENISITNGNIDESAQGLFSMPNLKSLSLNECKLRMNIDSIVDNDTLTSLTFSNISFIENYYEETDGFIYYIDYDTVEVCDHMDVFKHFKNLQNLSITNQKLTDISVLSNLKELENVDVSSNFITDISMLSSLPKLKTVNIKDNPFNVDPSTIELGDGVLIIYQ